MPDISNILDTIEQSEKIWYSSETKVVEHRKGSRSSYNVKMTTNADYLKKIAKRTVISDQSGTVLTTTTAYKDNACTISACDYSEFSEKPENETIAIAPDAYNALFLSTGELRPVIFSRLDIQPNTDIPNTLRFTMKRKLFADAGNHGDGNTSNGILKVCSPNTVTIHCLTVVNDAAQEHTAIADTEMVVHLNEAEVIL